MIVRLAAYGIDGIEGVYTTHTEKETEYFRALAGKAGAFRDGRFGYPSGGRRA